MSDGLHRSRLLAPRGDQRTRACPGKTLRNKRSKRILIGDCWSALLHLGQNLPGEALDFPRSHRKPPVRPRAGQARRRFSCEKNWGRPVSRMAPHRIIGSITDVGGT